VGDLKPPKFLGVNFSMAPSETLSDETGSQKSKMAAEKNEIKRSAVSIHDSNEIPTAIHMFLRSGDTTILPGRLSDVRIREKSKMADKWNC